MSFSQFQALARTNQVVPLFLKVGGEFYTPQMVYLKLRSPQAPSFLLESAIRGEQVGRYSFVGFHPREVLRYRMPTPPSPQSSSVFTRIQSLLEKWKSVHLEELPPLTGGLVGYLGYDVVREIEHLPGMPPDSLDIPDVCLGIYTRIIAFDHLKNEMILIANLQPRAEQPLKAQYEQEMQRLTELLQHLQDAPFQLGSFQASPDALEGNFTPGDFQEAVRRAREAIFAGDIFQVVLSQRFRIPFSGDPFQVYRALRRLNPSPYLFFLDFGDFQLIGSSPEMLVRQEGNEIELVPIAGTRHRGRTPEEDESIARELKADPKELAEHMMLVDLARNDVGRVAQPGSVRVDDLCTVERYSHVMHIISRVYGTVAASASLVDTFRAVFPAGTVSGAPKIRAMEIIDELEPEKRSFYAGSVGYFDFTGRMNHCITIRTILARSPYLYLQAGAGIVADSHPEKEYQETLHKIRALQQAITIATGGSP
ncbi:MAG: anthranilate synthase component I [Calditrichaeota bacterium]|nr:anthranilate synthase component I [Calditrichota bacterium]